MFNYYVKLKVKTLQPQYNDNMDLDLENDNLGFIAW